MTGRREATTTKHSLLITECCQSQSNILRMVTSLSVKRTSFKRAPSWCRQADCIRLSRSSFCRSTLKFGSQSQSSFLWLSLRLPFCDFRGEVGKYLFTAKITETRWWIYWFTFSAERKKNSRTLTSPDTFWWFTFYSVLWWGETIEISSCTFKLSNSR